MRRKFVGWCYAFEGELAYYYRFYSNGRITRKLSAVDGKRTTGCDFEEVEHVTGNVYLYGGNVYRWDNGQRDVPRDVLESAEEMRLDAAV